MGPLTIVADDLTGALDAAGSGVVAGTTSVVLGGPGPWPEVDVLAVDTDTRYAPEEVARRSVAEAVARSVGAGRTVFKKIDSLLRGHPGAEVAAAVTALGAPGTLAVVAPAFPGSGRTTQDGRVHLHGVPHTAGAAHGRVDDALGPGGLRSALVGVPADPGALARELRRARDDGYDAVVVDALTDAHLARVVTASGLLDFPTLLTGSGGLAASLVGRPGGAPTPGPDGYGLTRVLTVVGSYSTPARAQVAALVRAGATRIHPSGIPAAPPGGDLVLTPDPSSPFEPARARAVAAALGAHAARLAPGCGALVLTGGETARAVAEALGVARLDVLRELEPGVVLSRAPGAAPLLVTKAGSFGDAGSLVRIRTLLHAPS